MCEGVLERLQINRHDVMAGYGRHGAEYGLANLHAMCVPKAKETVFATVFSVAVCAASGHFG